MVETIDQHDAGLGTIEAKAVTCYRHVEQFCDRTRDLDTGWAPAHHHEVQCAIGEMSTLAVCFLQSEQDVVAEMTSVLQRVEGMGVLGSAGHTEEVDDGTGCDDQ